MNNKFWMVWNPGNRAPTYQHVTVVSAETEATRLARLEPGQPFVVLEAMSVYQLKERPVQVRDLVAIPSADLPF